MGGRHAAEDLLLSARAFSRAEREADALLAFQSVLQKHPRTTWAEEAELHLARTHALAGRWKDAAFALDEYVKRFPNGKDKREAERYRALAHLVIHDDKKARKLLEDLSGGAEDAIAAARWTNLAALAALRDGDKLHALARWADVVRTRPLSYPALVARARLKENGGAVPPAIEPAESAPGEPITIELPPPTDMLHRIGFEAEAEEALRERESAIVAKLPTRGTDALCAAYAMLDRGKRRYQLSQQIPQQQLLTAPGGKNRGAWECVFPRPYDGLVRAAAARSRLAPDLVWSVMRQESAFDPEVVSPARAVGLMQLLPETARATAAGAGIPHDDSKLTSPPQNITLGALYLRELLDKLGENPALAVAAYNAGPEAIQRWLTHMKLETLDVFVEAIPFLETRGYVVRVLGNLARYGYMDRGEAGVPTLALPLK
jgi:soluble lytic murein transglycosylase